MHSTGRAGLSFAVLVLAAVPACAVGQGSGSFPATARYRTALRDARARPRVDVESLFGLASAAAKEILADVEAADEAKAAGKKAEPALTDVEGLLISTEEALFAVPDPRFFAALARRGGREVDREFFELLVATRPEGDWPIYLEQQTDFSGCTRFDLPELPALYGRWLAFRRRHEGAYREPVAEQIRLLDEQLLGDCACGTRESAVAGLRAFVHALPRAPITARLKARLQDLEAGRAQMRGECGSG